MISQRDQDLKKMISDGNDSFQRAQSDGGTQQDLRDALGFYLQAILEGPQLEESKLEMPKTKSKREVEHYVETLEAQQLAGSLQLEAQCTHLSEVIDALYRDEKGKVDKKALLKFVADIIGRYPDELKSRFVYDCLKGETVLGRLFREKRGPDVPDMNSGALRDLRKIHDPIEFKYQTNAIQNIDKREKEIDGFLKKAQIMIDESEIQDPGKALRCYCEAIKLDPKSERTWKHLYRDMHLFPKELTDKNKPNSVMSEIQKAAGNISVEEYDKRLNAWKDKLEKLEGWKGKKQEWKGTHKERGPQTGFFSGFKDKFSKVKKEKGEPGVELSSTRIRNDTPPSRKK